MSRAMAIGRGVLAALLVMTMAAGPADARRGGSFGSRGARTYYSPATTQLAPTSSGPVVRSMTARPTYQSPQYQPSYAPAYNPRPRFGFGSGLLTGVVAGGLIGSLFGHHGWGGYGMGGGAGMGLLATLIQLALLGGLVWFVLRLFRGKRSTQPPFHDQPTSYGADPYVAPSPFGMGPGAPSSGADISLSSSDQEAFERLLIELQDAFGHEDYGRLRTITTPEIMSYLAEELSDNATHGRRNEVSATRLLDAEVSEAWRDDDGSDYATIAMRYESIDVMRDRNSGAILTGDPGRPTRTTELWTFIRPSGSWSTWKVSAIQEA